MKTNIPAAQRELTLRLLPMSCNRTDVLCVQAKPSTPHARRNAAMIERIDQEGINKLLAGEFVGKLRANKIPATPSGKAAQIA